MAPGTGRNHLAAPGKMVAGAITTRRVVILRTIPPTTTQQEATTPRKPSPSPSRTTPARSSSPMTRFPPSPSTCSPPPAPGRMKSKPGNASPPRPNPTAPRSIKTPPPTPPTAAPSPLTLNLSLPPSAPPAASDLRPQHPTNNTPPASRHQRPAGGFSFSYSHVVFPTAPANLGNLRALRKQPPPKKYSRPQPAQRRRPRQNHVKITSKTRQKRVKNAPKTHPRNSRPFITRPRHAPARGFPPPSAVLPAARQSGPTPPR